MFIYKNIISIQKPFIQIKLDLTFSNQQMTFIDVLNHNLLIKAEIRSDNSWKKFGNFHHSEVDEDVLPC